MCVWPSPLCSSCACREGRAGKSLPVFSHQLLVFLAAPVVEDLEVYKEVLVLQSLHDDGVGVEAMDIFSGREGLDKDDVVQVGGNHEILVSAPCSGWEAVCVICVELATMHCFYVEAMDVVVWWLDLTVVAW